MSWLSRLSNVFRSERLSRDLDRELEYHIQEEADRLEAMGMTRELALEQARRRFGNRTSQKERAHDIDALAWLESLAADLRYATRALIASPGFAIVAILSLALGIGANTAIFSLTNALLLKPLPVVHPEELVSIHADSTFDDAFTNPLWEQIRDLPGMFSGAFAYGTERFDLAQGGVERTAAAALVSGDMFRVLGVRPIAGRLIENTDDVRGCGGVVAISAGFAEREYGAATAAVGKIISLNGHPFPVVGVTDPEFFGLFVGRTADVYLVQCAQAIIYGPKILDQRSRWYLNVVARMDPAVHLAQLRAKLRAAAPGVYAATLPGNYSAGNQQEYLKRSLGAEPAATGMSELRGRFAPALYILAMVVGVVLLIACANIANLLLARASARQREIAIRLAVGAGRWRVIRQLLTESLLLAVLGAGLGALFAGWASQAIVGFITVSRTPAWLDLRPDVRVLGFTAAVAVGTVMLFGLVPAWRATRVDPQTALKAGGRGAVGDGARHTLGKALVIAQVALSLALVAASGLLLGSFRRLVTLDPGFHRDGVLLVRMELANMGRKKEEYPAVKMDLLRRVRAIPGVTGASASLITPLAGFSWNDFVLVPGYAPTSIEDSLAMFNEVSDGYFATMGTPFLEGRDIRAEEAGSSHHVAVVNQALAKQFFAGVDPVGRTFRTQEGDSTSPPIEVVGLVGNAKYQRLDEKDKPTAYIPIGQGHVPESEVTITIRTAGAPMSVLPAVRAAAAGVSPTISLGVSTFEDQVSKTLARPRLMASLSAFFGALALLLSVIGLYGTMSYSVERRRTEIGVRMALGAAKDQVLGLVVREASRLIALGVVAGAVLTLASTRLVKAFLYGVTPTDPTTLATSGLVLAAVALGAALIPAWRAARMDPVEALREG